MLLLIVSSILLFNSGGCDTVWGSTDAKNKLLNGDRDEIIAACHWIENNKIVDTATLTVALLTDIIDQRISTSITFYNQTPYVSRINCLKKISGLLPKNRIDSFDSLDASVINIYLTWAIKKHYLASIESINLIHPYYKYVSSSKDVIDGIKNHNTVNWLNKYRWEREPLNIKNH